MMRSNFLRYAGIIAAVFIVLVGSALVASLLLSPPRPAHTGYSGVFLTDGRAYFGKIESESSDRLMLSHVYYFPTPVAALSASSTANIPLERMGNEVYGPGSQMEIRQQNILYVTDLRAESKVVKAIESDRAAP